MTQTSEKLRAEDRYEATFQTFASGVDSEPTWLTDRRRASMQRFQELGFPTKKNEAWKYTPTGPMVAPEYDLAGSFDTSKAGSVLDEYTYWEENAIRLTFVDGQFSSELSSLDNVPQGVTIASVSDILKNDPSKLESFDGRDVEHLEDGFRALNSAFQADGAFIDIPKNVELDVPIHILYLNGSGDVAFMANPRNIISLGENAKANVVERYSGIVKTQQYLLNALTEVFLGAHASLDHMKIQLESEAAFHVGACEIHQDEGSRFDTVAITVGGKVGRNEFLMAQGGAHTDCNINGLYVVDGERIADQYVVAHHTQDHSNSEQFFKGIVDGKGLGIFNGAIVAEEGVKGTDAHQTNKNLLLSDDATAETRPQLEIYCDEIACSHGATVGQLDAASLFYLRSRGIDERTARTMLTRAFAGDVIERITNDKIKERLESFLDERVHWEDSESQGE